MPGDFIITVSIIAIIIFMLPVGVVWMGLNLYYPIEDSRETEKDWRKTREKQKTEVKQWLKRFHHLSLEGAELDKVAERFMQIFD